MEPSNAIAYFIDDSIQEIPSVAAVARETGGVIYTTSDATCRIIRSDHPGLNVEHHGNIQAIRDRMAGTGVRVIVYPDYHIRHFKRLPRAKHVQIFHGISDKAYDYHKELLEYDLFFIPGPAAFERYERRGLLKRGTGVMIGCPKLDRVFLGCVSRENELARIGLPPAHRTVLYAPTWVDRAWNSSWKKFRASLLEGKPKNVNLIVKRHPNLSSYRREEVDAYGHALSRLENSVLVDRLPDIVPLMAASDLLVGDVSSVTREYLAFRRPFVFLSNKPKWMWSGKKTLLWECGTVVRKPNRLWEAVERALEAPERHREEIDRHFRRTFYMPDGKAGKRAAEAVRSLIT